MKVRTARVKRAAVDPSIDVGDQLHGSERLQGFECPCCQALSGRIQRSVTAEAAALQNVKPWADRPRYDALVSHIGRLWGGNVCHLVECESCGATTSYPFVGGDSRFYELAYGHTSWYPANKWEFREALRTLPGTGPEERLRPDLRVLEIGAGSGAFLRQLISGGVDPGGLAAIEYSAPARRRLADLRLGYIGDETLRSDTARPEWCESFDAIAMFQVLEHLDALVDKLSLLRTYLRPGGRLLIAVPYGPRMHFNEEHGGFLDQPPNHITRFTAEGLQALAERAGLKVTSYQVQALARPLDFTLFRYYRYLRLSQAEGTLAARVAALSHPVARRFGVAAYLALTAPLGLPILPSLRDGMSVLAVLDLAATG